MQMHLTYGNAYKHTYTYKPTAYGYLSVLPKAAMTDYHTLDGLDNRT